MVCEYGMSPILGPQNLGSHNKPVFLGQGIAGTSEHSDETAQRIDQEVHRVLTEAYAQTMKILTDNKDRLIALSEILIEREVLDFEDVDSIMKTGQLPEDKKTAVSDEQKEENPEKKEEDTADSPEENLSESEN
jgi:cell division protease FtsH